MWEGITALIAPVRVCVGFSTHTAPPPYLSLCWFLIVVSTLQIKSQELFDEWVSKLRHHRLYRQNEIAMYPNEKSFYYPHFPSPNSPSLAEGASIRKVYLYTEQHTVKHNEYMIPPGLRLITVFTEI